MIKVKNIKYRVGNYLILLVIFCVLLSGCSIGGNNNNNNNNNNTNNTTVYNLIWWNLFEDEATVKPLIDKYHDEHPNVNISYVQRTDGYEEGNLIEQYRTDLEENLMDGEPLDTPDIVTIHNTWLGRYQPKLIGATNILATDVQNNFFPVVTQDFVRNGVVYGLPLEMDSLALVVNTQLMAEISAADSGGPENSWFDLLDQAKRVTKMNNQQIEVAGFAAGLDNVQYLPEIVSMIMMQSGITMTETDSLTGFTKKVIFADNFESDTAAGYFRRFYTEQKTWDQTFDSEIAAFLEKKLVMLIIPSWRLNDILTINNEYSLGLDPKVYSVPQVNPSDPDNYVYWADYWGMSVTKDSQERGQAEVAWDFINFMTQEEQLTTLNTQVRTKSDRNLDIIYPRVSMAANQKSDNYLGQYVTALEKAKTWDMVDGFMVRQIFFDQFGQSGDINIDTIQSTINTNVIDKRLTLLTQ